MARLECDAAIELFAHRGKKAASDTGVEREAWRQLHQQATEPCAERRELREEPLQGRRAARETLVMRDRARDLHREAERSRHARRPSFESRGAVRAIEGGIDLHGGKRTRIAREVRFARRKSALLRARNAPSRGADVDLRGHGSVLLRKRCGPGVDEGQRLLTRKTWKSELAPWVGLEPTTNGLTVRRSTN